MSMLVNADFSRWVILHPASISGLAPRRAGLNVPAGEYPEFATGEESASFYLKTGHLEETMETQV